MERQIPQPGQFYRDMDDRLHQIVAVAIHTETEERMVVYQALYGAFSIYVCPLSLFWEKIEGEHTGSEERKESVISDPEAQGNAWMMEFLDARTDRERLSVLDAMKDCCNERIVQTLAISQDISLSDGDLEQQFQELRKCIAVRMKYEGGRLRR